MADNIEEEVLEVAREIAKAGKNIVFTGAGISTESGIPDFRSSWGLVGIKQTSVFICSIQ